jgi:membrane glycosyltransferase
MDALFASWARLLMVLLTVPRILVLVTPALNTSPSCLKTVAARRWLYLFVVLASTVAAVTQMTGIFQVDGFTWREIFILVLFAILFAWR